MSVKKLVSVLLVIAVAFGFMCGIANLNVKEASAASGPYNITIKYVDDKGNAVANDDVIKTNSNGKYSLSITTITGYTFYSSSSPLAGTLTEDETITMVYKPIEIEIRVTFVDEEGLPIKGAKSKTYKVTIHDYLLLDLREIGQIEGYRYIGDQEVIAVTAVGTVKLRLTYVKDDGAREGGCSSAFDGNNMCALGIGLGILAVVNMLIIQRKKVVNKKEKSNV